MVMVARYQPGAGTAVVCPWFVAFVDGPADGEVVALLERHAQGHDPDRSSLQRELLAVDPLSVPPLAVAIADGAETIALAVGDIVARFTVRKLVFHYTPSDDGSWVDSVIDNVSSLDFGVPDNASLWIRHGIVASAGLSVEMVALSGEAAPELDLPSESSPSSEVKASAEVEASAAPALKPVQALGAALPQTAAPYQSDPNKDTHLTDPDDDAEPIETFGGLLGRGAPAPGPTISAPPSSSEDADLRVGSDSQGLSPADDHLEAGGGSTDRSMHTGLVSELGVNSVSGLAVATEGTPASFCANGHANPPYTTTCRVCLGSVSAKVDACERPSAGRIVFGNGDGFDLDRTTFIGRKPTNMQSSGVPAEVIVVDDKLNGSSTSKVSRSHVRITVDGWHATVCDLDSSNGTVLRVAGQVSRTLRPNVEVPLDVGAKLELAGQVIIKVVGG